MKHNFKKLFLTTFFIFSGVAILFSQSNFCPGYIITNEHDTINGLIDNRSNIFNCEVCVFKTENQSAEKKYYPGDINSYRIVDDKFYTTKEVKSDTGHTQIFAEYLVDGIVNLFYYANKDSGYYIIEKEGEPLIYLTPDEKKQIQLDHKSGDFVFNYKKYVGKLKYAFRQVPELYTEIDRALLNHKSLSEITKKYHEYVCGDQNCVVYLKKDKIKLNVLLSSGISISWINVTNKYYYAGTYNTSTSPYFSLSANLSSTRISEKFALSIAADLGKANFSSTDDYNDHEWHVFKTCKIKFYPLDIYTGIKYTAPKGKFRLTVFGGGGFRHLVSLESSHINEYVKPGEKEIVNYSSIVIDKSIAGLVAYTGYSYFKNNKRIAEFKFTVKNFGNSAHVPAIKYYSTSFSIGYYLF